MSSNNVVEMTFDDYERAKELKNSLYKSRAIIVRELDNMSSASDELSALLDRAVIKESEQAEPPPVVLPPSNNLQAITKYPIEAPVLSLPSSGNTAVLENKVSLRHLDFMSRHNYSTRSAFNASGTKIFDVNSKIYNVADGAFLYSSGTNSETVWSNTDPNKLFGIRFGTLHIVTLENGVPKHEDTGFQAVGIGSHEGGVSSDDRYIVINNNSGLWVYDLVRRLPTTSSPLPVPSGYDSHKISVDGAYVVIDRGNYGEIYDNDFTNKKVIPFGMGHACLAIDAESRQVIVHKINKDQNFVKGSFAVTDLETNQHYSMLPEKFTFNTGGNHFSYAIDVPGVIYGSFSAQGVDWIGSIPIAKENEKYTIWAGGTRQSTNANEYACQPKASVSRDGKKIAFTSCDSGSVQEYLLVAPNQQLTN